eukprot:GFKZ01006839.1.p1 GENE.GFKZ01006839.1~~GFKZ01006839.1.p1  ORF type:complete len:1070 (+),score=158.12 GFKZ01006839.1:459-3668(+)
MENLEEGRVPPKFSISADEIVNAVELRDAKWVAGYGGVDSIAEALHSSPDNGLSGDEVAASLEARIATYGSNVFKYPPPTSILRLFFNAFKDPTILILSAAAIASLIVGSAIADKREEFGYLEGVAIVIVIMVVVLTEVVISRNKELKFRQLNSVKDNHEVQIIRGGVTASANASDIVVGDVIKLTAGDKVPADALLVEGSDLKTNESSMTGEPIDIAKDPAGDAFMLSGTTVSQGIGKCLVIAVGERSQWGVILKGLIVEPANTPLQNRLDRLAISIGKLGILFATLTFVVSLLRWIIESARSGISISDWDFSAVLDIFIDAVTIVVVAIPEGLPLAITLGLAFAMRKMMKDNNLVRRLEACETMGSATQLNADKTGTLTQNRMTVVEGSWAGHNVVYDGVDNSSDSQVISDVFRLSAAVNMVVNSQANLQYTAGGVVEHLGSKTECALLQLVQAWGMEYKSLRAEHKAHHVYMFDSIRKRMSTTEAIDESTTRLHTKGAPEVVLPLCSKWLDSDGQTVRPLDENMRSKITSSVEEMARRGLRTLLMAYRDISHNADDEAFWSPPPEADMTYIGVVGIKDPIRPETKTAVRQLREAGVTVRMVTGDNPLTARFIAEEAGILDADGIVIEGPRFRAMTDEQLEKIALKIQVLARSTPNDKMRLVRVQRKLGEVTSVTGDGTNDGPALKEADVGFALGIAGTGIAKEACDIIIMDDNIMSMTKAVLWGRNVYESIRKFLQFQLVVNVVAVTLNFISACAGVPLPLGAVPLLWVNMIMDSMGALALATESPRPEMLKRKPYGRRAPLINRAMYRNIVGVSIYQLAVSLVLQFAGDKIFGLPNCGSLSGEEFEECELELRSIIFNVFVFMQIASEINSRRIVEKDIFSGILRSPLFIIIVAITVLVQIGLMLGVGGSRVGEAIGIGRISGAGWGASVLLGALVIPWGFLVRFFPLDWCFGPTDDDPSEMSKLEQLLRIPRRKLHQELLPEDMSDSIVEKESSTSCTSGSAETYPSTIRIGDHVVRVTGKGTQQSPSKMRLRVFVHAVAFVNVVSRTTRSKPSSTRPSLDGDS